MGAKARGRGNGTGAGCHQAQHPGQNIISGCYRWPWKAGRVDIAAQRAPGNRFPGKGFPAIYHFMQNCQNKPASWGRIRPAAHHLFCASWPKTATGEGAPHQPLRLRKRRRRLLGLVTASSSRAALPRADRISWAVSILPSLASFTNLSTVARVS